MPKYIWRHEYEIGNLFLSTKSPFEFVSYRCEFTKVILQSKSVKCLYVLKLLFFFKFLLIYIILICELALPIIHYLQYLLILWIFMKIIWRSWKRSQTNLKTFMVFLQLKAAINGVFHLGRFQWGEGRGGKPLPRKLWG